MPRREGCARPSVLAAEIKAGARVRIGAAPNPARRASAHGDTRKKPLQGGTDIGIL
jgi:hypothetical protein